MEMLTIDPKHMTSHAFDRRADPEWAAWRTTCARPLPPERSSG